MAVAVTAIVGAAIGVTKGIVNNMQRNSEFERELANYGMEMAAIDMQASYEQEALVAEASTVQSNMQRYGLQVEQNAQASQAQAEVAAAASGTTGQSVDVTSAQIDQNAGFAQGNIYRSEQQQLAQIEQTSRDINITAESSKISQPEMDTRGGLLSIFNQGLQGFLFGR